MKQNALQNKYQYWLIDRFKNRFVKLYLHTNVCFRKLSSAPWCCIHWFKKTASMFFFAWMTELNLGCPIFRVCLIFASQRNEAKWKLFCCFFALFHGTKMFSSSLFLARFRYFFYLFSFACKRFCFALKRSIRNWSLFSLFRNPHFRFHFAKTTTAASWISNNLQSSACLVSKK